MNKIIVKRAIHNYSTLFARVVGNATKIKTRKKIKIYILNCFWYYEERRGGGGHIWASFTPKGETKLNAKTQKKIVKLTLIDTLMCPKTFYP